MFSHNSGKAIAVKQGVDPRATRTVAFCAIGCATSTSTTKHICGKSSRLTIKLCIGYGKQKQFKKTKIETPYEKFIIFFSLFVSCEPNSSNSNSDVFYSTSSLTESRYLVLYLGLLGFVRINFNSKKLVARTLTAENDSSLRIDCVNVSKTSKCL